MSNIEPGDSPEKQSPVSGQKLTQEQAEAQFNRTVAEQKRVLKTLSKNQLIRIVVDMSVRAFYQQARIEELEGGASE